jgi:hypothetical protein
MTLLATTSPDTLETAKLVKAELKGGTRVARREQG